MMYTKRLAGISVALAGAAWVLAFLLFLRDAASPCPGILRSVPYEPPPAGVRSLPLLADVACDAHLERPHDLAYTKGMTAVLGAFRMQFLVRVDAVHAIWEAGATIYDPSLCADSAVEVRLPEESLGCPRVSLHHDVEKAVYLLVYDNTGNIHMPDGGWLRGPRRLHRDTLVAAFVRSMSRRYVTRMGRVSAGAQSPLWQGEVKITGEALIQASRPRSGSTCARRWAASRPQSRRDPGEHQPLPRCQPGVTPAR
jgi:hypothetical protein